MAHSLEVRPVLLDHPLVIHSLALPSEAKIRNGVFKAALVEAVRPLLADETIKRKKIGFQLPLGTWLRSSLKEKFREALERPAMLRIFDHKFLQNLSKPDKNYRQTQLRWALLVFSEWVEYYRIGMRF